MKSFSLRIVLIALISVMNLCATAQNMALKETPTYRIITEKSNLVYQLNLVNPEFSPEQFKTALLTKEGILACSVEGNLVTITTVPEISIKDIADVLKAEGYRSTYHAVKLQIREGQYVPPPVRHEDK